MYTVTLGEVLPVIGSFGNHLDYTVRLKLRLRDKIDDHFLKEAVEKTRRRYPYLCVRMKKDNENYFYEENLAPIAVLHTDSSIRLNAEETNFHVWCVCYHEDWICLDFYHGITDGTGMYMVLATLLYYYCENRYGITDHTGIRTLNDPILPEETIDPMEHLPSIDLSGRKAPAAVPVFSLAADAGLTQSTPQVWDIAIPEEAFVSFSSANDASPGTMVSILFARAIDALYPERQKIIMSRYSVNARPMLHAEKTYHNCLDGVAFPYTDRVKAMPFEKQCTVHRGATFIQSDADNVYRKQVGMASYLRSILQGLPTLEAQKRVFGQMMSGGDTAFTYMVSYVGQWKLKALSPYILEFWTHAPSANPLLTEIAAVNGKVFLSVHQTFQDDLIIRSFLRQLEENGILYQLRQPVKPDNAQFPEPEIES